MRREKVCSPPIMLDSLRAVRSLASRGGILGGVWLHVDRRQEEDDDDTVTESPWLSFCDIGNSSYAGPP